MATFILFVPRLAKGEGNLTLSALQTSLFLAEGEGQSGGVKLGGNGESQVDFDGKHALLSR